jgi:hypothetical protein
MKYGQFFVGLLVGAVAMHVLHKMGYMSNNPKNASDAVKGVNEDELSNYSDPLRKKYDIVLKPNKYSRRVVEKAKDLTEGRYEVDLNRVKQPVSF